MAAKPLVLPEWASAGTNNTEPSLTQKQSGWIPNQDGVSDYDNWYKELVWEWCKYVNDGDFVGPITIEGVAGVGLTVNAGDSTFNGNVHITDVLTVDDVLKHGNWLATGKFCYAGLGIITVAGTPSGVGSWSGTVATNRIDMGLNGDAFIEIPMVFTSVEKVVAVTLNYADNANGNVQTDVYFGLPDGTLQLQPSSGGGIASGLSGVSVVLTTPANPFYGLWIRSQTTSGGIGPKLTSWRVTYGS